MSRLRPERVQEALRQEISKIVLEEIKDPRIGFLTITKVDLTKDLRYAKVYFSVLGGVKEKALALKGLNSAKGYIKGKVADRIKLRLVPDISFRIDESIEHTKEIYDLFERIKKKDGGGLNEGSN
ncbi:MAG: 30S ribosome-binding factor RbfA [Candidatus Omnitrophota bacterium]|jgi:ribosome-binding factor A|nr:30S ribosome-binding factor RbfA [Candidatus Omnitrophota bacterium]